MIDTSARCTGDDSCKVSEHWPDPASSGPHRGTATAAGLSWLWPYAHRPNECPGAPHRGPEGPNEDIAQCGGCGYITYSKRPPTETFGHHLTDCSLPIDHESYCQPGGSGHPDAEVIRG